MTRDGDGKGAITMKRYLLVSLAAIIVHPSQAHATCALPREAPLPAAQIELVSPSGQTLTSVTGGDGILKLKRMRKGDWQVRLSGQQTPIIMKAAKDRKLILQSVTVSYSCSAPGGPVSHTNAPTLRQLNKPKDMGE